MRGCGRNHLFMAKSLISQNGSRMVRDNRTLSIALSRAFIIPILILRRAESVSVLRTVLDHLNMQLQINHTIFDATNFTFT